MEKLTEFIEKVLSEFSEKITDYVFLEIENNRELMREYLHLVESETLLKVNSTIGKSVKMRFKLANKSRRNIEPKSKLIQSHQEFE